MQRALDDMHAEIKFNHLSYFRRIRLFLWRMKWRLLFFGGLIYLSPVFGNGGGFISARIERSSRKYKKRWLYRYNPHCITYTTALETVWEPTKLSRPSTERLSETFVRLDRELEYGVSRQLIIDALKKVSF